MVAWCGAVDFPHSLGLLRAEDAGLTGLLTPCHVERLSPEGMLTLALPAPPQVCVPVVISDFGKSRNCPDLSLRARLGADLFADRCFSAREMLEETFEGTILRDRMSERIVEQLPQIIEKTVVVAMLRGHISERILEKFGDLPVPQI